MRDKKDRILWGLFGLTNSGKSTLFENKILGKLKKPVFILDSKAEYTKGLIFYDVLDMIDFLKEGKKNKSGIFILRPNPDFVKQQADVLFSFINNSNREVTLVIEEAGKYMDSYNINPILSQIIFEGAHHGYSVILIAQRPTQLHNNVFTQLHGITTFNMRGSGDIRKVKEFDKEAGDIVPELDYKKFEYVSFGIIPNSFAELRTVLKLN